MAIQASALGDIKLYRQTGLGGFHITDYKELETISQSSVIKGITGKEVKINIEFNEGPVALINLRTNQHLGVGRAFRDQFKPWEGNLYQVID